MKTIFIYLLICSCFVVKSQTLQKVLRAGGSLSEAIYDIQEDEDGSMLVLSGSNSTNYHFNDSPRSRTIGDYDILLNKLDSKGMHLWEIRIGGTKYDVCHEFKKDSKGNIILSIQGGGPYFRIDTSLIQYPCEGFSDTYVIKLSPQGKLLWTTRFNSSSFDAPYSIAVDKNDNIFVTGNYGASLTVGGLNTLPFKSGYSNLFFAKLSPLGQVSWAKRLLVSELYTFSIDLDEDGNCYGVGTTNGKAYLNPDNETEAVSWMKSSQYNGFLAKYNPSGKLLWAHGLYGNKDIYPTDIKFMQQHLYVSGLVYGRSFFLLNPFNRTDTTKFVGSRSSFVAKYDTSGHSSWVTKLDAKETDTQLNQLTVDNNGQFYLTGTYYGNDLDLDPSSAVVNLPTLTGLLGVSYDNNGNFLWKDNYPSSESPYGTRLVRGKKSLYFCAQNWGSLSIPFPSGVQTWASEGEWDGYLGIYSASIITELSQNLIPEITSLPFLQGREVYLPASNNMTTVQLFTATGQLIFTKQTSEQKMPVPEYIKPGFYILMTETNNVSIRKNVIVE